MTDPRTPSAVPPGWVLVNGIWQPEPARTQVFPVQVQGFCPPKESVTFKPKDK